MITTAPKICNADGTTERIANSKSIEATSRTASRAAMRAAPADRVAIAMPRTRRTRRTEKEAKKKRKINDVKRRRRKRKINGTQPKNKGAEGRNEN